MKRIELDITGILTVKALHVYLAWRLDLPAHYGKNLDALYDMLCEHAEEMHIILAGAAASNEMAAYLPRLERMLADCAADGILVFERRKENA